ncbi:MAG: glucosamine-6-phosphate deaminase [Bacteroidales bacterium]|jgi:glucosamine-6-phosphate deaminase|nr:glucosamine-6-phosphate deaminase [Bacteroidales bacterium]
MKEIIEKIPVSVYKNSAGASIVIAHEIAELIKRRNAENKKTVLGLATGVSPIKVYEELARMHREEGLSFKNVVTFNLDEYYPMQPTHPESYVSFMNYHLFDHIDIKRENIHIPDGTIMASEISDFCTKYEYDIEDAGGIDIQLLGIGRSGHIGFNEPGSPIYSKTRLVTLDIITRRDAADFFGGLDQVPKTALTMGISTILKARRIILLAWENRKSDIIKETVEGQIRDYVPATFLQEHNNVDFILDFEAASKLSRIKLPWLFEECKWDDRLTRKAVIWLSLMLNKSVLKLTDKDYIDHHMGDLLQIWNSSYDLNIRIFNELQHTITGWPGGKPNADDSQRPERATPYPKRAIIFSPHPDDDVISMGGTLARLVKQNHDVHVAYQTSGNHAVFDDDLMKYLDFIEDAKDVLPTNDQLFQKTEQLMRYFHCKGNEEPRDLAELKGIVRKGEAKAACRFIGIPDQNIHFLKMPFYEMPISRERELGEEDIQLIVDLLQKVKPHQIYVAGDFNDPHRTHKICFDAVIEACERTKNETWSKDCYIWLYRGAWDEWDIHEADMAVPLSPDEVTVKRKAIFKHQTQKDIVPFPGSDVREFWQRAEERNHQTAVLYDKLGLADYQAMELFVRYHFD